MQVMIPKVTVLDCAQGGFRKKRLTHAFMTQGSSGREEIATSVRAWIENRSRRIEPKAGRNKLIRQ